MADCGKVIFVPWNYKQHAMSVYPKNKRGITASGEVLFTDLFTRAMPILLCNNLITATVNSKKRKWAVIYAQPSFSFF